jgi:hypothetical protein
MSMLYGGLARVRERGTSVTEGVSAEGRFGA